MATNILEKSSKGSYSTQLQANSVYKIVLKGAGGGCADSDSGSGGSGHIMTGYLKTTTQVTLKAFVGEGGIGTRNKNSPITSFNGGGSGGRFGAGGGGATDIRIGGTALNNRIFIAGGGGGSADSTSGQTAGHGGHPKGGDAYGSTGGTQTSGGTGFRTGSLGNGANANITTGSSNDGGGGGGGYYGGGSGDYDGQSGGGGSSYYNPQYILYPSFPSLGGGSSGSSTQSGKGVDGYVSINKLAISKPTTRIEKGKIYYSFNVEPSDDPNRTKYPKTLKVSCADVSSPYTLFSTQEDITTEQTFLFANLPEEFKNKEITFTVDNGYFTTTTVDAKPPTITFPQETWSKPWGYNTTIQNAYEGTDTSDTSLDYEVEHYVENVKIGNTLKTKDNTFNTNNFIPYNTETHTFLKVRALQSADTEGGTGTDIWSEWYTSPTTTYTNIPEIITFKPDFLDKIFLQGETKACGELFSCVDPNVQSLEVTHIINEVEDSTSTIEVSQGVEGATITPPLKYHIYNPKDWQYTYQLKIRAKNSIGQYSKYYLSPKTKAEYNIAPKDPTFITKAFKDIYVVNEKFRVEWNKVTDPNGTDVTYDLALLNSEGVSLATWTKITDNFKEVVIPNVSPQTGCSFTVVAFSDRLYSSKVSSKPFAITDVNITDCSLTFPNLTTNLVIDKVNEIAIVINGDTRLIKTTNLSNYVLPLHYFRSGKNTLTLKVKDKINTVIERTWDVNLTLDKANLVSSEQPTVTGYFAFNYDNAEHFNKAVELQKSNIDLGVVEHTFLGSTPFEGSNTVTQKLEITRKANDDTTQLRTIKITGAIE